MQPRPKKITKIAATSAEFPNEHTRTHTIAATSFGVQERDKRRDERTLSPAIVPAGSSQRLRGAIEIGSAEHELMSRIIETDSRRADIV
jgi:hypothetical protein